MKKKLASYSLVLLFVFVGIVFIAVGCYIYSGSANAKLNYIKTEATIIDIRKELKDGWVQRDFNDRYNYYVTVQYEMGGQTYTAMLDYYSSGMRVGGTEIIYCNPSNPRDFASDEGISFGIMFCFIGLAPIVVVFAFLKGGKKEKKNVKYLKENGQKLTAVIKEVKIDSSLKVNDTCSRRLVCEAEFIGDAESKRYRSKRTFEDVSGAEGKFVDVYIDVNNPDNYFVDIESIRD